MSKRRESFDDVAIVVIVFFVLFLFFYGTVKLAFSYEGDMAPLITECKTFYQDDFLATDVMPHEPYARIELRVQTCKEWVDIEGTGACTWSKVEKRVIRRFMDTVKGEVEEVIVDWPAKYSMSEELRSPRICRRTRE